VARCGARWASPRSPSAGRSSPARSRRRASRPGGQRLELEADGVGDGAHLRLYTLTTDTLDGAGANRPEHPAPCGAAADPALVGDDADAPAPLGRWRAAVQDATSLLAHNAPGRWLWVAGVLQGDGARTPTVRQIRLTHDEAGWLTHLPQLYHRPESGRDFLERMLAAFESVLDESDRQIDALPRLFDPHAAPDAGQGRDRGWLDWLAAGWTPSCARRGRSRGGARSLPARSAPTRGAARASGCASWSRCTRGRRR
jgi:hypothetical protein